MRSIAGGLAAALLMSTTASAANVLVNGDFETGDLTGWSPSIMSNGAYAAGPSVVPYDVSGAGVSNAGYMIAGQHTYEPGEYIGSGGGFEQEVNLAAGMHTFSVDVALFNPSDTYANAAGDRFFVGLGNLVLGEVYAPALQPLETWRATLQFDFMAVGGNNILYLAMQRPYLPWTAQYFDNAVLEVSAVPEPSAWVMMILGLGGVGAVLRRRRALPICA